MSTQDEDFHSQLADLFADEDDDVTTQDEFGRQLGDLLEDGDEIGHEVPKVTARPQSVAPAPQQVSAVQATPTRSPQVVTPAARPPLAPEASPAAGWKLKQGDLPEGQQGVRKLITGAAAPPKVETALEALERSRRQAAQARVDTESVATQQGDRQRSIRESTTPISGERLMSKQARARKPKGKGGRRPYFRVMDRDLQMMRFLAQFTVATPRMLTLFTQNRLAAGVSASQLERAVLASPYWDEKRKTASTRPSEATIYSRLLRLEKAGMVRREYFWGERDPWLLTARGHFELQMRDMIADIPEPRGVGKLKGNGVPHLLAVALVAAQILGDNQDSPLASLTAGEVPILISEPQMMRSYQDACRRIGARDEHTKQALLIRSRKAFTAGQVSYSFPVGANLNDRTGGGATRSEDFHRTEAFRWLLPAVDNWDLNFGKFKPSKDGSGNAHPRGDMFRLPDLIVKLDDRHVAVEVELARKNRDRYEQIMAKYAADEQLLGTVWVVTKPEVEDALMTAARKAGVEERTMVTYLHDGFGCPLPPGYNLSRY